jgi:hypothetical protein
VVGFRGHRAEAIPVPAVLEVLEGCVEGCVED